LQTQDFRGQRDWEIFFSSEAQEPNSGSKPLETHRHTVGLLWTSYQLVVEAATYSAHNKHKRPTSMSSAGFEPTISAV